ncbi:hypothetical protein Psed_5759 [Pseudonocardia dioxanivorans CB1190]|uniref:Uncharacterized protein n=1 Tax=Pseudonocardia dioxanivorans (strain ATCC 55486 / DSM 44775 / JCM 13855 / CB1190) TaxID=675635 RepID=F4D198_PSEUX|nr:hypothetical protein [Pseudonocardia dioxanivorans]AEA27886.1 hypothetical protein Psed_5759 [Pseudonocardia dioxanivorans CB1190]
MIETTQPRQVGKWTAQLDALSKTVGVIVTPDEDITARVREALPARDVRLDLHATPGVIRVYEFANLPLHLYTKAEARRSRS